MRYGRGTELKSDSAQIFRWNGHAANKTGRVKIELRSAIGGILKASRDNCASKAISFRGLDPRPAGFPPFKDKGAVVSTLTTNGTYRDAASLLRERSVFDRVRGKFMHN